MARLLGKSSTDSTPTTHNGRAETLAGAASGYMPPPSIFKKLFRRQKDTDGKETVTMSVPAFHKLLEAALSGGFDDQSYLEKFNDVRTAVKAGFIPSALRHYATDGYFEGRMPLKYAIDEAWYIKTYPDAAQAIKSGKVRDGAHHFRDFGYAEGRVPNINFQRVVAEWRDLEKKHSM